MFNVTNYKFIYLKMLRVCLYEFKNNNNNNNNTEKLIWILLFLFMSVVIQFYLILYFFFFFITNDYGAYRVHCYDRRTRCSHDHDTTVTTTTHRDSTPTVDHAAKFYYKMSVQLRAASTEGRYSATTVLTRIVHRATNHSRSCEMIFFIGSWR